MLNGEMCRVLRLCVSEQAEWCAQISCRPLPETRANSFLQEVLSAYTNKHIDCEATIIRLWTEKWAAVWALAEPVISGNIPDDTDENKYMDKVESTVVEMLEEEEDEEEGFEMWSNEAS